MSTIILNELKVSDARNIKNAVNQVSLEKYLKSNGFEKEGSGFNSVVYGRPNSNLVVKISDGDGCWVKFYDFAIRNQKKNPHLPRIGKILKVSKGFAIFMERLLPLDNSMGDKFIKNTLNDFHRTADKKSELQHFIEKLSTRSELLANLVEQLFHNMSESCDWDLHGMNVMKRASGDYVIIDPYV